MPRPRDKYEREHQRRIEEIQRRIDAIYAEAVKEAAAIGVTIDMPADAEKPFSFDDYPLTEKRVNELLESLRQQLHTAIVNSVRSSWTLANNKNNELCNVVFGSNVGKLTQEQYRRYYSTNDKALDAFIQRKENGMNLSDRVWHYSDLFKNEIEMGLDLGIREGKDAASMARDLKQYLQHPDKLFRRVRDEHGNLHLSKAAADFHPGRGVYRSSYMNARRLAATETNIAYRTADHERMKNLDFVVGIEIHLSHNHTCKGRDGKPHPFTDICNELEGKYPKDFKFTGWHPHCRCYVTSILKSDEEIAEDTKKILRGEEVDGESENTVEDVPEGFRTWLKDNKERARTRYSVPYFLKDNMDFVPKEFIEAYASRMPYETYAEYEAAMKYNKKHSKLTKEQMANVRELNKVMPVVQGQILPFGAADNNHPNPNFGTSDAEEKGYEHNCQTCTVVYELRRRGFYIEAKPNPVAHKIGDTEYREMDFYFGREGFSYEERFLNADGTPADYVSSSDSIVSDTVDSKKNFILGNVVSGGRYEIECQWKNGGAHVFIIEKHMNGNIIFYDPQTNKKTQDVFDKYCEKMGTEGIKVMRTDDKLINPKMAKRVIRSE